MDTLEYRSIISELDLRLEEAKREAERKRNLEELGQRVKLREHWIQGLESKKAEFEKYAVKPPIDIDAKIAEVKAEKADYERQLASAAAQPAVLEQATELSESDRGELASLAEEIQKAPLWEMVHQERWTLFEIWSIRWRIVADRAGAELAYTDVHLRDCFRQIRELMKDPSWPQGWFIDALDKKKTADWVALAYMNQEKLARLIDERCRGEEAERAAEQALSDLSLQAGNFGRNPGEEQDRILRHHARNAAKFEHLRDEVADILLPFRPKLEDEFGYLWKNGKEEPEERAWAQHLSCREIVSRIVKRMKSKALIGACHGPWDKICKGFPDHDKGRAKEAVDMLVKAGILRAKPSIIGRRLSIEPEMLNAAEAAVFQRRTGVAVLDEWLDRQDNGEKR